MAWLIGGEVLRWEQRREKSLHCELGDEFWFIRLYGLWFIHLQHQRVADLVKDADGQ